MENIIKYICKKYQTFISIKNHSLLEKVLILEDKNFKIPNKNEIKEIILNNNI